MPAIFKIRTAPQRERTDSHKVTRGLSEHLLEFHQVRRASKSENLKIMFYHELQPLRRSLQSTVFGATSPNGNINIYKSCCDSCAHMASPPVATLVIQPKALGNDLSVSSGVAEAAARRSASASTAQRGRSTSASSGWNRGPMHIACL